MHPFRHQPRGVKVTLGLGRPHPFGPCQKAPKPFHHSKKTGHTPRGARRDTRMPHVGMQPESVPAPPQVATPRRRGTDFFCDKNRAQTTKRPSTWGRSISPPSPPERVEKRHPGLSPGRMAHQNEKAGKAKWGQE